MVSSFKSYQKTLKILQKKNYFRKKKFQVDKFQYFEYKNKICSVLCRKEKDLDDRPI